ncbi:hypothetical protein TKK_0011111 [Trichogramma kaykai]|uniref:Major facilitator superfamily (MFS) profile domain-containing protein n=1 Tax=Trichogramma kaykai TaxID=54128 RepID=A0ABD2WUG3_9HYME
MSLPREWSLHHNPQQELLYYGRSSVPSCHAHAGCTGGVAAMAGLPLNGDQPLIVTASSQEMVSTQQHQQAHVIDENMNQQHANLLGSLFSIHSAPVFDLSNGADDAAVRPASLVVQATATSTPLVPPHISPPDTIEDEDNDNLLTISSLTARPLIAKSRELSSNKRKQTANSSQQKKAQKKRKRLEDKRRERHRLERKLHLVEPLDGGYGWVVVFGAFFVQFWVAGLVKSYGVLYVEVMEMFSDSSATVASWIPAILSALCLALAPVTSMLSQKYSCRAVVFVGGLFCSLGLIISYFATNLYHLLFTFGVLTGIGGGLSTTPGIILVSQYFDKHRALANGICVSGTAAGGFVFPMLIEYLVASFGFHGTLLILGGCMLHVCASATLYRPLEANYPDLAEEEPAPPAPQPTIEEPQKQQQQQQQQLEMLFANNDQTLKNNMLNELFHQNVQLNVSELTDSEEEKDILGKAPSVNKPISKIRSSSMLHSVEDLSTDSTCFYKSRSSVRSLRASNLAVCRDSYGDSLAQQHLQKQQQQQQQQEAGSTSETHEQSASKESLAQRFFTRYIDLGLLKETRFIMMCLSVALMSTGSPYMLYYLPAYVLARGYTKSEAGYLVAISAALDLCGRLGLGWLSDLQLFDRRKGYIGSIIGAGLAVLLVPIGNSFYVLAGSVALYGLCLGCWFLLVPVLLADQFGTDKISSSYGLVRMFQSIGAITIPPLAGLMRDSTGSYSICFLFMGTCMVLGGLPLMFVTYDGNNSKSDVESNKEAESIQQSKN